MKRHVLIGTIVGAAVVASSAVTIILARAPSPVRQDATLMRPEVTFDRTGNKLRIRGAIRVLRPVSSGIDHAVAIRLTVSAPEGGPVAHEEDLGKIDYHRGHGRDVAYPVKVDLDMDVTGLDVKVAAVDATGLEFASVVDHGAPRKIVEPAADSR